MKIINIEEISELYDEGNKNRNMTCNDGEFKLLKRNVSTNRKSYE